MAGDYAKADALAGMFAAMAGDADGAVGAAMRATAANMARSFEREQKPDGQRWAPLRPSTLVGRRPGPILGGLVADIEQTRRGLDSWVVASRVKDYAKYHLGPDRRNGRPAREYLPITAAQSDAVAAEVSDALTAWAVGHAEAVR